MVENKALKRIAVIGLDALSWSYLAKLFNNNIMPYTNSIVNKSFLFSLHAFPPNTPASWTSIMTGVNPGKHGIFAFDYLDPQNLVQKLYTALNLEHPRIHEMLSLMGKYSIVINPIPAYPIIPVKYAKILSHTIFIPKPAYHPENMKKYANILTKNSKTIRSCSQLIEELLEETLNYLNIVEDLAYNYQWNLFWINLFIPDLILHKCGFSIFNKIISYENKLFNTVDAIIKTLDSIADATIIVSDHGFSTYNEFISINDVLMNEGYVKIYRRKGKPLKEYREIKKEILGRHEYSTITLPLPLLKTASITPFKQLISIGKIFCKLFFNKELKIGFDVDLIESKAFLISRWNLGVHVKETKLLPEILRILETIKGIKWVKYREEVFPGPFVKRAPHLVLYPNFDEGYMISDNKIVGQPYLKGKFKDHHPMGVLIVHSPSINLNINDKLIVPNYMVTPLIMFMLGTPLSEITDGLTHLSKILDTKKFKFTKYVSRWKIMKKIAMTK